MFLLIEIWEKNMKVFLEENGHTVKLVDTYKSIKNKWSAYITE